MARSIAGDNQNKNKFYSLDVTSLYAVAFKLTIMLIMIEFLREVLGSKRSKSMFTINKW